MQVLRALATSHTNAPQLICLEVMLSRTRIIMRTFVPWLAKGFVGISQSWTHACSCNTCSTPGCRAVCLVA